MSTSTSSVRVQGTPESALGGAGSADVQEIEDQISMIDRSYEMAQRARGQGEDSDAVEKGQNTPEDGLIRVMKRQHPDQKRGFGSISRIPMDSPLHAQYDHMRRTVDALTALGKDPREGELSPTEITNAISRDRLPTPLRIKWNKKTKKLRLTPGAETDEARTKALNWLARTKWRKCGDSLRIEETPEMKIARPQKRNAAHAALYSMRIHQE
ncbi:hypothetical protein T4D_9089 [Trichinella pseudospiralis]|uniref:Uncharacterized protein n=1 Tax=Trichinella pseudospiralis TaxID=6337 RepID=A0A0V1G4Z5_TRIPS|nr:hypothetical protein T4D_9089 [Trichinella pseudospiralis]